MTKQHDANAVSKVHHVHLFVQEMPRLVQLSPTFSHTMMQDVADMPSVAALAQQLPRQMRRKPWHKRCTGLCPAAASPPVKQTKSARDTLTARSFVNQMHLRHGHLQVCLGRNRDCCYELEQLCLYQIPWPWRKQAVNANNTCMKSTEAVLTLSALQQLSQPTL